MSRRSLRRWVLSGSLVACAALVGIQRGARAAWGERAAPGRTEAGARAGDDARSLAWWEPPATWARLALATSLPVPQPAVTVAREDRGAPADDAPTAPRSPDLEPASLEEEIGRLAEHAPLLLPDVLVGGFVKLTGGGVERRSESMDDERASGMSIDAARLTLEAQLESLRLVIGLEGSQGESDLEEGGFLVKRGRGGDPRVLDAWAALPLSEAVSLQVGTFRVPLLFGSMIETDDLLFVERSYNGAFWQGRDVGAMLVGAHERVDWWLALQNGRDDAGSDVAATARAALRVFGEGEAPRREGAYDADLGGTLYLAAAWHQDGAAGDDTVLAAEAYYTHERLSLAAELADYGAGFLDQRFWSVTAAWMLEPDRWELAARYEDFDQRAGGLVRVGLNRYLRGRSLRWQAGLARFDGDGHGLDAVQLGFVASL